MERKPTAGINEAAPSEGPAKTESEKPSTTRKKTFRAPLSPDATPKAEAPIESPKKPEIPLFDVLKDIKAEPDAEAPQAEKSDDPFDAEVAAENTSETEKSAVEAHEAETSPEEEAHINYEIAADHLAAIDQADEVTAEELAPAHDFLERVKNGEDIDEAFSETAAELGMDEDEIAEALAEAEPETESEDVEETESAVEDAEPMEEEEIPIHSTTPTGGSGAGGAGGSGGGAGGAGSASTPSGSGSSGSVPFTPAVSSVAGLTPPVTPAVPANRLPDNSREHFQRRRAEAGQLLLVGIVGYLIGRRRGRIRSERKMAPIRKKLEKRVDQLEQSITLKEQQLVAAKAKIQERFVASRPVEQQPTPIRTERAQPSRTEASRLNLEKPVRAERLGHMIIAAEAPKVIEKPVFKRPNNLRQAIRPEEVKSLRRNDLLEISEKIVVEGANLRRIYESRLIGEKQLRHLVSEYLQGKDIREPLRKEMVEHEIDFERDPILRDRVRSHLSNNNAGSGIGSLLASAGIVDEEPNPELERQVKKETARREAAEKREQRKRATTDVAMVTAITVLAIIVAILALKG